MNHITGMHMALETDKTKDTTKEKLVPPKPLLDVLKELDYVNDDKINQTIKTHRAKMQIGTLLAELGLIAHEDLDDALKIQYKEKEKRKIGDILVDNRAIDEKTIIEILSLQMGFPFLEPEFMELDHDLFKSVPYKLFMQNKFIPVKKEHHDKKFDPKNVSLIILRLVNKTCNKVGISIDRQKNSNDSIAAEANFFGFSEIKLAQLELQIEDSLKRVSAHYKIKPLAR